MDVWEEAAPLASRILTDEHRDYLVDGSHIDPDIVESRGYYSPTKENIVRLVAAGKLNKGVQKADAWIGIPIYRPDGTKHCEVFRLFGPNVPEKMKYVWPNNTRNALDVHPGIQPLVLDPAFPLIVTEGVKKADAILSAALREGIDCVVVAANGCWGWRAKVNKGSVASPDFSDIVLADRRVWVVSDSDFRTNNNVRRGWSEATSYLGSKGAGGKALLVVTPASGFDKQGADDYLRAGNTLRDLLAMGATPELVYLEESLEEHRPIPASNGLDIIRSAADTVPHLLTPVVPERGISVVAGHSATYKTWHGLALALDGAFQKPWLDHPDITTREDGFTTLYVNKEMGQAMLGSRLKKLANNPRYKDDADFETRIAEHMHFTDDPEIDLNQQVHRDRLEEFILENTVNLVIFDSLSMCWSGDENSNSEVGILYNHLRGIISRTACSIILIHHTLKPAGINKKNHIMFAVRGAGQIVQQADSALVFNPLESEHQAPDTREVVISYAKTRTVMEPPAFVVSFKDNDSLFHSLNYVGLWKEKTAGNYASSPGDTTKLRDWMVSAMMEMPALKPESTGLRTPQLIKLLKMNWPLGTTPPSDTALKNALKEMVEVGDLEQIIEDRRNGNLYKLPEIEDGSLPATSTLPTNREVLSLSGPDEERLPMLESDEGD